MPMDKISTQFLNYNQIDNSAVDLISDAFGFDYYLHEVLPGLDVLSKEPDDKVVNKMLMDISRLADKY
ncbi:MAG TPA: hypothetical protein DEQ09_08255 [Bacteroidales bacterium]|nr:hypothetical protein [Bacteroidales bacterium]